MALGQGIRSLAMVQAASNFNHNVQVERKEGHVLVRHGVYGVLRHPSYFGFFWWGLGTQLMLGNVVCLAGYAVVLWRFFYKRVHREEEFLVAFFGDEYVDYRKHTWVGIPFI
ncbi:carboxyl methyltransferase [Aspergillus sp. HF37]|nr:carboxyl methyltransferase [Aspergillus sp. HF37]